MYKKRPRKCGGSSGPKQPTFKGSIQKERSFKGAGKQKHYRILEIRDGKGKKEVEGSQEVELKNVSS